MRVFAKIVDCISPLAIFAKHFILFVSKVYEYTLIKLNKILVCCHLFHKKLGLQFLQIYFQIQFYLHIITLTWDFNQNLKTRVFCFKLIHPCSWIHIILASHYLTVQTHHNSSQLIISLVKVKKSEGNYTVLFYIHNGNDFEYWQ